MPNRPGSPARATLAPDSDFIESFVLGEAGILGRIVRLGPALGTILARHDYPVPVSALLSEALALAAVLAGGLKYEGVFSLQTRGDGPVGLLVADVTSDGNLRAYADFDAEKFAAAEAAGGLAAAPVPRLLGGGYLAFTVDQGPDTERYQGIVDLCGANLADCARNYFTQSEQVATSLRLVAGQGADGGWRAAALALQRMPLEEAAGAFAEDSLAEVWHTAEVLLSSATDDELLDPDLATGDLLYRLFHELGVRVFPEKRLRDKCRCSEDRVLALLASFSEEEKATLERDGVIDVTCQFCSTVYMFPVDELDGRIAAWRRSAGDDGEA